jgi:hypothetical protein
MRNAPRIEAGRRRIDTTYDFRKGENLPVLAWMLSRRLKWLAKSVFRRTRNGRAKDAAPASIAKKIALICPSGATRLTHGSRPRRFIAIEVRMRRRPETGSFGNEND